MAAARFTHMCSKTGGSITISRRSLLMPREVGKHRPLSFQTYSARSESERLGRFRLSAIPKIVISAAQLAQCIPAANF
ncbi:hypothetical protein [Rhizobium chutanense]|uniref:hypothetical protein n=1 Tax=Rhizobium chutanense TaxID=2035448 RepID=UPI00117BBC96|nr:hypothetical protein [Rhizobium chutanense]